ncbi:Protein component of the small (40S) ribosomal subunit [Balamuthia mandrillaris]
MSKTAITVKDVPPNEFVVAYAQHLKRTGKLQVPKWVDLVKTASYKELSPYDPDWYYIRAASMARKIYLRGGMGVGTFRKVYGGRKNNGTCPSHFAISSGSIARHILHELEKIRVVEKDPKGGRRITQQGQRDLDRIAFSIPVSAKRI